MGVILGALFGVGGAITNPIVAAAGIVFVISLAGLLVTSQRIGSSSS